MALRKPHDDNLRSDEIATNGTRNDTMKKSSNITATTSNVRSSELESARRMSRDHTTISAADETGIAIAYILLLFTSSQALRLQCLRMNAYPFI